MITLRSFLIAALTVLAPMGPAFTQAISIEHDGISKTVVPLGFHDFHITLTNNSLGSTTFRVVRTVNQLPADDWQSTICTELKCYDAATDETDSIVLGPFSDYSIKFSVYAGTEPGLTGHFRLAFVLNDEQRTELGAVEIQTTVGASSVAVDPSMSVASYPNPAVDHVVLPLGEVGTATSVQVFAADGSLVRAIDGEDLPGDRVRVDVSDLGSGAYFYRVLGSERTDGGSFVVAR